jgi:hypothetical protein
MAARGAFGLSELFLVKEMQGWAVPECAARLGECYLGGKGLPRRGPGRLGCALVPAVLLNGAFRFVLRFRFALARVGR